MVYTLPGMGLPGISSIHSSTNNKLSSGYIFNVDHRKNSSNLSLLLNKKTSLSRKIFAHKSSYDSDSPSATLTESQKVLVPGVDSEDSPMEDKLDSDPTVNEAVSDLPEQSEINQKESEVENNLVQSEVTIENERDSVVGSLDEDKEVEAVELSAASVETKRTIPPPGDGQKIYDIDPLLRSHREHLDYRYGQYKKLRESIDKYEGGLEAFSRGYEKLGFTRSATGITYREWAPGAKSASLIGDFNNWNPNADVMTRGARTFLRFHLLG